MLISLPVIMRQKSRATIREAGLDVTIKEAAPDTDPVSEVVTGKAEFGVGTSGLLLARAAGNPVVVLAVIFQQSPYAIYAAPGIRTLHDLVGKRLMLEPQTEELLAMLKKEGVPIERINVIPHSLNADGLISGNAEAIPGQYVMLSMSDTGCGMDQATIDHIFEPFFTTKDVGEGYGMGLSTVNGILKQNNGFITVSSELGKGTTFRACFPHYALPEGGIRRQSYA